VTLSHPINIKGGETYQLFVVTSGQWQRNTKQT